MAIWSTSYQVGGVVATALATYLLTKADWRAAFVIPAAWTALVGGLIFWTLPDPPATEDRARPTHSPSLAAFLSVDIWILGTAYFCLKLIRYSLLFWLPLYLHDQVHYDEARAGYVSLFFELGGIVGALAAGTFSDRLSGRRGPVVAVMSLGLGGALFLYQATGETSVVANCAGLALVGFMLFGPDTVVSGAAAQDLGGTDGVGAAAGVINGVGSFGGVAQGFLTSYVAKRWGWPRLFDVFMALAVAAAVILVGYTLRERARTQGKLRPP
jgi:sugar phosphate permease